MGFQGEGPSRRNPGVTRFVYQKRPKNNEGRDIPENAPSRKC